MQCGARTCTRRLSSVVCRLTRRTAMRSKYEFETPEDRITQLENLFARTRPGQPPQPQRTGRAAPTHEAWQERIYLELDRVAASIYVQMQDILMDYERAKRTSLSPRVKKDYDQVVGLHYWRSNSIRGIYLQWSTEESKPYLTVAVFAPLDANDRKLPQVMQRVTGVRAVVRPIDRDRKSTR